MERIFWSVCRIVTVAVAKCVLDSYIYEETKTQFLY